MTAILIFFIAHWFMSLFAQTFFHHRYAAHRMFTMTPFWERIFYLFTFVSQGSSFLVPRAYAILHRMHHAYSDTEDDPHSPNYYTDPFRMMWRTKVMYHGLVNRTLNPQPEFEGNCPEWRGLDRFGDSMITRTGWGVFYSCFYLYFAPSYWWLLLLPVHYLMGVFHGAIVNWCGHLYGYRNFQLRDKSRNTLPVDILMMGELYQNNHHKHPNRVNFAHRWFELDPAYPLVRLLVFLRIIRLTRKKRAAPARKVAFSA